MSKWISVENAVPEENTQVLCFAGGRFGAYVLAEIIIDKDGCPSWHIYGKKDFEAGYGGITHWMNLPDAPKHTYMRELR